MLAANTIVGYGDDYGFDTAQGTAGTGERRAMSVQTGVYRSVTTTIYESAPIQSVMPKGVEHLELQLSGRWSSDPDTIRDAERR